MSQEPELGTTRRDQTVAVLRGVVGAAPVVGPLLVELINEVIPNQRLERIESFLRLLAEQLEGLQEADLKAAMSEPENVDLFEDGAYQASRALSEERREQIAWVVAEGISDQRREYLESKRMLRLLEQLDDAEVIMLAGYLPENHRNEYWTRHAAVLRAPGAHLASPQDNVDRETIVQAGTLHLLQLGLLEAGEVGRLQTANLSRLGRLLLRRIGLAEAG